MLFMSRRIRQWCPVLAILYLFVADILVFKVKTNNQVLEIKPSNYRKFFEHIQNADDLTLFLRQRESVTRPYKAYKRII